MSCIPRMHSVLTSFRRHYSAHIQDSIRRITIQDIQKKYKNGTHLTMCTAYDYITANWVHKSQCDMILVGDSLAMTSLGYDSTTDLPFDEFKYHVKSVCRTRGPSLIVVDMPFGSFEQSLEFGISNAVELMKLSSGVTSLKIEMGTYAKDKYTFQLIKELCSRGIPVMPHIGLTPQRAHSLSGFKVQASKDATAIRDLYETALKLQELGCWSCLLECVPHKVASFITSKLRIPTIGIGAGGGTSGQVLVVADMLDMQNNRVPRFVKKYNSLENIAVESLKKYNEDVTTNTFPETDLHAFKVKEDVWQDFVSQIENI
ncbi:hypothetical protein KAFR_0I00650 [Kazachstania africana CBS 2517]|uniref:3-methyl-2-oxobutanoate hydroxymethyltransferase n=1 Tax=Kazachstania africana (strain ATCC 22294 / BCRC 22015 / CBS 2517 / CECT 1963 / NBRC 1671 / NRRL Y-8276) TaxID=1071382 RepID=H2AZP6_KAZAF|nr:hypothetical protein KAFR_0I00650 [Kazachstania africana CBS 2517]CCF59846.1 hypothetical protein KAFR_0I00650 [Kazachstania africana CBS 2517]